MNNTLQGPWRRACGVSRRLHQYGQSTTEYVIVCGALALILGIGMVNDNSVLKQLIAALQQAYKRFSFAMSLPT